MTSPVVIGVCKKNLSPSYGETPLVPTFSTTPSEAALLASKFGANIFISDNNKDEIVCQNYEKLKKAGMQCEIDGHTDKIYDSDLWIVSPGIPKDANIIKKANKLKIPIISEIEFASRFTKYPIIAVTGSNGKSTTVNNTIG